jgi:protein SCO1/2
MCITGRTCALFLACALLAGLPRVGVGQANDVSFKSGTFDPPRLAPDFELQGSNGSAFKLSRYRGKVVALAFGFTHCVRICPTTLSTLAQVSTKLGPDADKLQVVFVTVDPERDSTTRLKEFLALFNAGFVGATGSSSELQAVRQAYGVTINKEKEQDESMGYQVHHSSSIFLIDREGKLRLFVPFGKSADQIVHDIKLLLR